MRELKFSNLLLVVYLFSKFNRIYFCKYAIFRAKISPLLVIDTSVIVCGCVDTHGRSRVQTKGDERTRGEAEVLQEQILYLYTCIIVTSLYKQDYKCPSETE